MRQAGKFVFIKFGIGDSDRYGESRPQNQVPKLAVKYPYITNIKHMILAETKGRMEALFYEGTLVATHYATLGYGPVDQQLPLPKLPPFNW